ncbi:hypothetical protein AZF37_01980 [endosymbiont 'TC1' of Trimyema compressum]|nr:hypothetical protein AZF37_01980 [endosymbiont 'TC1' of Trimyema compressum]
MDSPATNQLFTIDEGNELISTKNIDNPMVLQEPNDSIFLPRTDENSHGCVYPNMCLECIFSKEDAQLIEGLSQDKIANPSAEFTELLSRYEFNFRGVIAEEYAKGQLFEIKKDWVKVRIGVMWYGDEHDDLSHRWKYKLKYELVPENDKSVTIFEFLDWMRQ